MWSPTPQPAQGLLEAPAAAANGYCSPGWAPGLCLYPFRESFYERLGYVTFPQPRTARFSPQALLPLLKVKLSEKSHYP